MQDIQDAYAWYEEQLTGLGESFLQEFYHTLDKIAVHPQYYGFIFREFRNISMKRFTYTIIFKIEKNKVFINSVKHFRRNQKF